MCQSRFFISSLYRRYKLFRSEIEAAHTSVFFINTILYDFLTSKNKIYKKKKERELQKIKKKHNKMTKKLKLFTIFLVFLQFHHFFITSHSSISGTYTIFSFCPPFLIIMNNNKCFFFMYF